MAGHITADGYTELGIGLISVGWMGKLHSRAYQATPLGYPELKIPGVTFGHPRSALPAHV
jgi:hypothetical protein